MAETATTPLAKTEKAQAPWNPFAGLRREIDRLFEDFDRDFWASLSAARRSGRFGVAN